LRDQNTPVTIKAEQMLEVEENMLLL